MMLVSSISFAQEISLGAGLLEESRKLGVGFATSAALSYDVHTNITTSLTYTKVFLQTGNSVLYVDNGDVLTQNPDGTKFNQLQVMVGYKVYTRDENIAIALSVGGATQFTGEMYKTFKLDIIPFPNSNFHPYLSWAPVIKGKFSEGSGWSHTVTMNLAIKL